VASLSLDRMRSGDLDEVVAIERVAFTLPWSRGAFLYEMEQNRVARCWVMREGTRVVGYMCLWEIGDEIHVTNIAVHPDWRRRGVGRALLSSLLEDARNRQLRLIGLEVRPSNHEARPLYESFGFEVVGKRKGYYYDTGEDALVMEVTLRGSPAQNEASGGNQRRA
jgi:ribosomal-protein-alanine N-acetyltransferase